MKLNTRTIIIIITTCIVAYLSFSVLKESKNRQEVALENAEIKNVKYGLLSIHSWKKQVSEIIAKKVKEFQLNSINKKILRKEIQKALNELLDEVEIILEEKTKEGGFFQRTLTSIIQPFVISVKDLRRRIPEFTNIILEELNNYKTREKLRTFIQEKIDNYLKETVGKEDLSKVDFIVQKYECKDMQECSILLDSKVKDYDKSLETKSLLIFLLSLFSFLVVFIKNKTTKKSEIFVLIVLLAILLIVGISTPMIDIDARVKDFSFKLLGEPIEFHNQILFYQSKSILDVVHILIQTGQYQSILVACLIFIFSIIFPISKLIASFVLLAKNSLYNNKIVNFLALKTSKWAMADVVVVAIFMAYIGFSGVISSQLKQLETAKEKVEILTTDNSNFGVGFFIFICFAMGGLFLASKIETLIKKNNFG